MATKRARRATRAKTAGAKTEAKKATSAKTAASTPTRKKSTAKPAANASASRPARSKAGRARAPKRTGTPPSASATTARSRARREPDFGPANQVVFRRLFDRDKSARFELTGGLGKAQTGIYVHGIGNHPEEQVLIVRWDRALFGKDMGERTRMAYWVNRARYPQPEVCDCIDPACPCHDPQEATRVRSVLAVGEPDPEHELEVAIHEITQDPAQQGFLRELGQEMIGRAREEAAAGRMGSRKGTYGLGSKGIGDAVLRGLTDLITGVALPDVQDFLFDPQHRKQMEDLMVARLETGGGPFVVVAHSQGSMIAYDVLRQLRKADVDVPLFVTIGSPLGLPPVRSVFKKWTGRKHLPFPPCVTRWLNVAATGDVVAFDRNLGDDIEPQGRGSFDNYIIARGERDENRLFDGNPHASMGYLSTKTVQLAVLDAVGREFARSLGRQVITSDLVERLETEPDDHRHPVLIEVSDRTQEGRRVTVEEGRQRVDARLRDLAARTGQPLDAFAIMHHARYISAKLRRAEVEVLRSEFQNLQVQRLWQNSRKKALISRSAQMVQAAPAHAAYAAWGHNIEWAVLDTGIQHLHPHFARHRNIASLWDCTAAALRSHKGTGVVAPVGGFVEWEGDQPRWPAGAEEMVDRFGHGTHVAGIIAGEYGELLDDDGEKLRFAGMAPRARLHSFKVLDDRGRGDDASIIMALDKIASINESAGTLRIHGINLSLGGNFDPSVYGCGHTPLCSELRRLWRQGVLITLAAGNEGFTVLQTLEDGPWQANLDLSIGDPANLEEAIAVGSVHRLNPHTYGISYFSSRGPTADGRRKPDLVAPGEKILSARADFAQRLKLRAGARPVTEDLYIAESGTSMAAPHVAGVLAAFLSLRREFIGYPDRVKQILLDNCTDLGRDCYAQGCGMPNLMRMLART